MANYSDLPNEIIRKIAVEHLDNQEDFESFKEVCSTWRSEVKDIKYLCPRKNTQLPWLMLADSPTSSYRRLYSLSKQMYRKIDLPEFDKDAHDHRRYFSSKGWLISVTRKRGVIHFFDVFTSRVIVPPTIPILSFMDGDIWDDEYYLTRFYKFYFPHRPSSSCSNDDDLEVAMVFDAHGRIAFWRPGEQEWVEPVNKYYLVADVCLYRGIFYSIDHHLRVIAYGSHTPKQPWIVTNLKSQGAHDSGFGKFYIVVLDSTLLVLHKVVTFLDDPNRYWTESFELFEVNVDDGKVRRRVEGIGNRALFVGYNSTFFIEACSSSNEHGYGCRPNSIYFTDDNNEPYHPVHSPRGGGRDMGIYCLDRNEVVHRFYEGPSQFSYETPPIWVQLPQQELYT